MDRQTAEQIMVDVRGMIDIVNRLSFVADQMENGTARSELRRAVGQTMLGISDIIRPVAREFPDLDVV